MRGRSDAVVRVAEGAVPHVVTEPCQLEDERVDLGVRVSLFQAAGESFRQMPDAEGVLEACVRGALTRIRMMHKSAEEVREQAISFFLQTRSPSENLTYIQQTSKATFRV